MGIKIGNAAFDARADEALQDPDVQRAVPLHRNVFNQFD